MPTERPTMPPLHLSISRTSPRPAQCSMRLRDPARRLEALQPRAAAHEIQMDQYRSFAAPVAGKDSTGLHEHIAEVGKCVLMLAVARITGQAGPNVRAP